MPLANILGVVLLSFLCLSIIVFVGWWAYAFFRAHANPTISTFGYLKDLMHDLDLKSGKTFVDLGCGIGSTLAWFAQQYPSLTYTGVDINTLALWRGRWQIKRQGINNVTLKNQDIYQVDLSNYDYVYCFLMPSEMKRIQEHFETHLPENTTVICAAFKLPSWKPIRVITDSEGKEKIFVYRK